jgi:hypothetical protein
VLRLERPGPMNDEICKIAVGQVLRDHRPKSATPARIDGLANLYAVTECSAGRFIPLEAGINSIAPVKGVREYPPLRPACVARRSGLWTCSRGAAD